MHGNKHFRNLQPRNFTENSTIPAEFSTMPVLLSMAVVVVVGGGGCYSFLHSKISLLYPNLAQRHCPVLYIKYKVYNVDRIFSVQHPGTLLEIIFGKNPVFV